MRLSCFKIPDSLCEELTIMVRNFWWGQKGEEKKMAWISWEKSCIPKSQGGMKRRWPGLVGRSCAFLKVKVVWVLSFLRVSPAIYLNFCTVWIMNNDISLLSTYFFKFTFQQILYHFLHLI